MSSPYRKGDVQRLAQSVDSLLEETRKQKFAHKLYDMGSSPMLGASSPSAKQLSNRLNRLSMRNLKATAVDASHELNYRIRDRRQEVATLAAKRNSLLINHKAMEQKVQEVIAHKNALVECSRMHTDWMSNAMMELRAKERRVLQQEKEIRHNHKRTQDLTHRIAQHRTPRSQADAALVDTIHQLDEEIAEIEQNTARFRQERAESIHRMKAEVGVLDREVEKVERRIQRYIAAYQQGFGSNSPEGTSHAGDHGTHGGNTTMTLSLKSLPATDGGTPPPRRNSKPAHPAPTSNAATKAGAAAAAAVVPPPPAEHVEVSEPVSEAPPPPPPQDEPVPQAEPAPSPPTEDATPQAYVVDEVEEFTAVEDFE